MSKPVFSWTRIQFHHLQKEVTRSGSLRNVLLERKKQMSLGYLDRKKSKLVASVRESQ